MGRKISCALDGTDVVQTTVVKDEKGALQHESVSRLGDRETVLGQIEEQLAEAARDRDGLVAATSVKPAPAGPGTPGLEVVFWKDGRTAYRTEICRSADGKVANEQTRREGDWRSRVANAEERLAELTELRNAIRDAK